jgi:DNA modification methylase
MLNHKLDKETLDKVRDIDGFPIGEDEDIVNLSDPSQYTACPNPWLVDFIKKNGKEYDSKTDNYQKNPFTFDVSADKHDVVYNIISYHTKVPPKAIIPHILNYTNPGDLIYDGFCGTGMTGVAAQICQNPELEFKQTIEKQMSDIRWGERHVILCDVSPVATFITYYLNNSIDKMKFKEEANQILEEIEHELDWMYQTQHTIDGQLQYDPENTKKPILGKINYTVWSDVFVCPTCSNELVFFDIAYDENNNKEKKLHCTNCNSELKINELERFLVSSFDDSQNKNIEQTKQVPVLINYTVKKGKKTKRYRKKLDKFDLDLIKKIENLKHKNWYANIPMMFKGKNWGDSYKKNNYPGITHVHHFYTKRNMLAMSIIFKKIKSNQHFLFWFLSCLPKLTKKNRFMLEYGSRALVGPLSGTHYMPSLFVENDPPSQFKFQLKKILNKIENSCGNITTTQSSSNIPQIPDNTIDYVFTDPPFGKNLMYSELNFLRESWLKVFTNNKNEAIINNSQKKGLVEYQELMEQCFKENYRILKPGRWMTVVFHNSQPNVWIAIQEALSNVGFVIADVRTLDKEKGTTIQVSNPDGAVDKDLTISAYKPSGGLDEYFGELSTGTEEGVWKFIDIHIKQLPIFVEKNDKVEVITERQKQLLFDRMIAFHVQKGLHVPPISSAEFYEKLHQKYPERDGMYFLSEQIPEYDQKRIQVKSVEQTTTSVKDEKSTILWLNEQLKTPQTYQDITPKFYKALGNQKLKHEKLPELSEILSQNFLKEENDEWHIPDPSKQKDLEKLREKPLLREFETYQESKGKLKQFRLEAIRAGFKKKWSENNYKSIVDIAQRLPENIIQEDSSLLMYYNNAKRRL